MRTNQEIDAEVKRVFTQTGVRAVAPVDVVAVAEHLGAEIRPELIASEDVSGGLYRVHDKPVIGVNAHHHPNRQRFTIAHELGHLVLHEEAQFVDQGYPVQAPASERSSPHFKRDLVSSAAVDPREIEANRFAASLLMPAELVLKATRGIRKPVRSEEVDDLARTFKVSSQAMAFRLTNLGVPVDQG